ncbi:MAG: hypothetical protein MZU95_13090 [Desulfomicrobium escambiense]|nr:hypothetical protein [Desulfomicrobium escambiense]
MLQKAKDKPPDKCPKCGGADRQARILAGHPVQGQRLVHHRLRQEELPFGFSQGRDQVRRGPVLRRRDQGQVRQIVRITAPRRSFATGERWS